jgi:hypothetical protein
MANTPNTLGLNGAPPPRMRNLLGWLRLWFLLCEPVAQRDYAVSGFGLMAFKYGAEALLIFLLTGLVYSPLDFINPLLSAREKFLGGTPGWFGLAWVIWTLPFLWIAVGMSVRRALDAGMSPWNGLWVLVSGINLVAMLMLACAPSAAKKIGDDDGNARASAQPVNLNAAPVVFAVLGGIAAGALYALVVVQAAIYIFHDYGSALFFGTPFVTGIASSYMLNSGFRTSHGASILVALAALFFSGAAMLLFAVEGVICILMAAPIMVPLAVLGAPIGKFLADRQEGSYRGMVGALLIVPLCSVVETRLPQKNEFVVTSSIDIAAPPETVWQNVISFPDINERPEWFFRLGISCPQGARITGEGIGAVRECVFTTGRFIEPITSWDAPRQLGFDVREQPAPMFELSPYRDLHPPHLDGAFCSTRGEFQLVPLAGGGTRLVGRTWYTLDIRPLSYWTIWSDEIVHRIHLRVLAHIKRVAEETMNDQLRTAEG